MNPSLIGMNWNVDIFQKKMTSNSDFLQDVEDGFLSTAGECGNSSVREEQF